MATSSKGSKTTKTTKKPTGGKKKACGKACGTKAIGMETTNQTESCSRACKACSTKSTRG